MAKKKLRLYFYRVYDEDRTNKFETLFSNIAQLQGRDRVWTPTSAYSQLMAEEADENGFLSGDFTHVRMENLPPVITADTKPVPLDLQDDEGLGERAAFVFHKGTRILLMQADRYANANRFMAYLWAKGAGNSELPGFLAPVPDQATLQAAMNPTVMRSLHFKVAGGTGRAALRSLPSLAKVAEFGDDTEAQNMEVIVSMGRRDGTLKLREAVNVARNLWDTSCRTEDVVTTLKVKAKVAPDSAVETFDLLVGQMKEHITFDTRKVGTRGKVVDYHLRHSELLLAWRRKSEVINAWFKSQ